MIPSIMISATGTTDQWSVVDGQLLMVISSERMLEKIELIINDSTSGEFANNALSETQNLQKERKCRLNIQPSE